MLAIAHLLLSIDDHLEKLAESDAHLAMLADGAAKVSRRPSPPLLRSESYHPAEEGE
jgi:hypothetical protein